MTRAEVAMGSVVFLVIIVAGFFAAVAVDRHYAAALPSAEPACVTENGSWKNWVWANVPMLSPKCP